MNGYLTLFVSIVLFTFQSVSSNIEINDEKEESDSQKSQTFDTKEEPFRQIASHAPGIRLGQIGKNYNRADVEALKKVFQDSLQKNWQQFTPPPVEEPNCFVEVQVTQKMPGKCTKLGGRIPACQAQDLLTIDYNSCK